MRGYGQPVALVAGGAGFLGSHLCESLFADGVRVICVDNLLTGRLENIEHLLGREGFAFMQADITEPLPQGLRPDFVYNLACPASPPHYQANPVHTMLTCVVGTRNLLELAAVSRARFLLASTSEVYGDPHVHPQSEIYRGNVSPIGPRACYDEGKRAAEALTFDYARAGRLAVRVARIFNTYGPRMRPDDGRLVSNLITQALYGTDITIYGDGLQTRSLCYVRDMVDGLRRFMACDDLAGPVNLGNPVETSVLDVANRIVELTRSRSRLVRRPLPIDDPRRRWPDVTLARRRLAWQPSTDLDDGLLETIAWFRSDPANRSAQAAGELIA